MIYLPWFRFWPGLWPDDLADRFPSCPLAVPHREADSLTPLDFYRATVEVQIALYNGIILAWKEKVHGSGSYTALEHACDG